MRTVQLAAVMVFVTVLVSAQSRQETPQDNLYFLALKSSILQMETEYGHIDDTDLGERMRTDYRHMIVEEDPLITKALPAEFENHFVEYLDTQGLVGRYGKVGKPFAILVIRPMQNEGRTLKIAVVLYWVTYNKHHLKLELSDWSNVELQYSCEKQQFVVSSLKLGGI
jgi:hypothetical protein